MERTITGCWSIIQFKDVKELAGAMIETQVQGKKVLVPLTGLATELNSAAERVPEAPAQQGHYTLQAITNSEGEASYLWMDGYVVPEGKILMDATFANGIRIIHNDEFVYAMVDADERFLFGIRVDGTPVFAKTPSFLTT